MSLVGVGYIDGKLAMRLLVTNPAAEKRDVDAFFASLIAKGSSSCRKNRCPRWWAGSVPFRSRPGASPTRG